MKSGTIIEQFRAAIIQIATPYARGTGFYLHRYRLIVTNEHVVRGNRRVVIDGHTFEKQLVAVRYLDPRLDLAFLEAPAQHNMPNVDLSVSNNAREGDQVIAVGHPFGLKYTATQGIVSNTLQKQSDVVFIQHDAALNPGNSGGPLINEHGQVIGINTFIIRDGNNIGFSLPSGYLQEALEQFDYQDHATAVRCHSCRNVVFEGRGEKGYCPHCGSQVVLPSEVTEYVPLGVKKTIEDLLEHLEYDVELSRQGPDSWEVQKGSARIDISYHEESGLIVGDAFLCVLPKDNIKALYAYLLHENYRIKGLTFSVRGQDIILSLLIYDRYLSHETGQILFGHLFQMADAYDNVLVESYGARWRS
jgi:serine protease Do